MNEYGLWQRRQARIRVARAAIAWLLLLFLGALIWLGLWAAAAIFIPGVPSPGA